MNSEATRSALQTKFPPRRRPLPTTLTTVPRGQCVEGLGHVLQDCRFSEVQRLDPDEDVVST